MSELLIALCVILYLGAMLYLSLPTEVIWAHIKESCEEFYEEFIERYNDWKKWKERVWYNPLHKFAVLLGIKHSPTFRLIYGHSGILVPVRYR